MRAYPVVPVAWRPGPDGAPRALFSGEQVDEATANASLLMREASAQAVESLPDYDAHRNGFEGLVDKETAAAAIRALKP